MTVLRGILAAIALLLLCVAIPELACPLVWNKLNSELEVSYERTPRLDVRRESEPSP